jgi:predicted 3-demethylubiquinone-9 3-methyltransferase (glyoxalase superfamily)
LLARKQQFRLGGRKFSQNACRIPVRPSVDASDGGQPARPTSVQRRARELAGDPERSFDIELWKQRRRNMSMPKNTICLWYDKDAEAAARFYAATFPDSKVGAVHRAPSDFPSGKKGDVLTVDFTVFGIPCMGLNGGPTFKQSEAFSFQIATDDQEETDRYWNAIVGNGGEESMCGWCKDKWGLSWQITPRVLTEAMAAGGAEAKRAFDAMMDMRKIDVAKIEAARRG